MTIQTDPVQEIFLDARSLQAAAVERLDAGDIRDAAEKAWGATKRATDALILARTGHNPERTPATSRELQSLAQREPAVESLVGRYYTRQGQLHGDCFYLDLCEPRDAVERRIRETADYIQDAQALATP